MQMQTNNGSPKRPSLEYFPQPGGSPRRVPLEPLPFTIGRIDTADLQIDSTRVSREHARIVVEKGHFVLRDLESTNGTYVNGKQVKAAVLADGDTLLVADFELTFIAAASDRIRRMATQLMTGVEPPRVVAPVFCDAVDDVRRMHEVLLQGAVFPSLERVTTLPDRNVFAHYATSSGRGASDEPQPLGSLSYSLPAHPSSRYHELCRTLALETPCDEGEVPQLMVDVDTWEIESNASLQRHLARLADLLPAEQSLIVSIPADAVVDLADVAHFRKELHELGISVCYRGFVGTGSQLMQYQERPPEFLVLAPSMLRAGLRPGQQHQKLKTLLDACQSIGCRPIASGIDADEAAEECYELGFELFWEPEPRADARNNAPAREAACAV